MDWIRCTYGWGERVYRSWWGNWRERDQWGDLGVDGWIILGRISKRCDVGIWTGLVWPSIGTGGWRFWVRWWTFGFCEMRGISWLAANQLASQEGLCTMEWVSKYNFCRWKTIVNLNIAWLKKFTCILKSAVKKRRFFFSLYSTRVCACVHARGDIRACVRWKAYYFPY